MPDYLFVNGAGELAGLMLIVLLASIVRGAIGFGFSALVVASGSFWLPPIAVISMVVLLEIVGSIAMLRSIQGDINYQLLTPLAVGGIPGLLVGVSLLASIDPFYLQLILGVTLCTVALISLFDIRLKPNPNTIRISIIGIIAGFYNGIAAIGGMVIATFLNSSSISVKSIRATMAIYFLLSEAMYLVGAYIHDFYTTEIFLTSAVAIVPMLIGIQMGTRLFNRLPEEVLRRSVLIVLVVISVFGLLKYL